MASQKVFLEDTTGTVIDNFVDVFGATGTTEVVNISPLANNAVVDQNIERLSFTGSIASYQFQQFGNAIKVYSVTPTTTTLVATIPLQLDADGTRLTFSDGTVDAKLDTTGATPVIRFGGTLVNNSAPTTVVPGVVDTTLTSSEAGPEFVLTTVVDDVPSTYDLVKGTVYGGANMVDSTFSPGDEINGNPNTVVELIVAQTGDAAYAVVNDVAAVELIAAAAGTIDFIASDWTNVGEVSLARGLDGLTVFVDDLATGVDLTIGDSVGGTIAADYVDGQFVALGNSGDGGASFIDGNVAFDVEADETGFIYASGDSDVTLGTVTGVGANGAELYVTVDASNSADVVVGNINLTAGDSATVSVSVDSYNGSGNITIGNIVEVAGDDSFADVSVSGDGDLTLGNVSMTVGESGSAYMYISTDDDGAITIGDITQVAGDSGDVNVYIYGEEAAVIVGDVSMTAGDGDEVTADFYLDGSADITIGDVTMAVGSGTSTDSAYASFSVDASGTGNTVTIGDITVTGGASADIYGYVDGNDANELVIGDVSMTVGDNGYVMQDFWNDYATSTVEVMFNATGILAHTPATSIIDTIKTAADITVGDIAVAGGDNADVYAYLYGYGNITAGDMSATVGDDGYAYISVDASTTTYVTHSATGGTTTHDVNGDITVGNVTMLGGDSASAYAYFSGDANVTIGNVDIEIGSAGTTGQYTASFDASGTGILSIGNVSVVAGDNNNAEAWMTNNDGGSDLTVGDITVSAGAATISGTTPFAGIGAWNGWWSGDVATGDLTVGNVSLSVGQTGDAYMQLQNYGSLADLGNLSVGDVTVNLAEDAVATTLQIIQTNVGTTLTTDEVAPNMGSYTVGDVTLSLGSDAIASLSFTDAFYGVSAGSMGDAAVGNITATLGIGASLYADVIVANTATGDIANVSVGDITVTGDDATLVDILVDVSATDGAVGNVVVGDINLAVGVSGSIDTLSIDIDGNSIGDVTIGDVTMTLGQSASDNSGLQISISADGGVGLGNIGNVSIGQISTFVGMDAYNSTDSIDVYASGDIASFAFGGMNMVYDAGATGDGLYLSVTATGDIGDITLGDINVTMNGMDTYISDLVYFTFNADNMGDITVGDFTLTMLDGTSLSYASVSSYDTMIFNAATNIGDVTFGNIAFDLGAYATHSEIAYRQVYAGGTIGDVVFGDVNMSLATGAYFGSYLSLDVHGDDGISSFALGDVTISNMDGTSDLGLYAHASALSGDLGAVTIGNVVLEQTGSYSAWASIDLNASGDMGLVTVGDISLAASVDGWGAWFSLDMVYGGTGAGLEVGTVTFDGVVAVTATANLFVSLDAGTADVTIAGLVVEGTGLMNDDYIFNVAGGEITIENIAVNVSSTAAGNYALTTLLAGVVDGADGVITLGVVDYSGYALTGVTTTGESIDVSGFDGDITIIGTDRDDTITDNDETTSLTGGAGADTFVFVNTNANLTLASVDVINDFQFGIDTIEIDIVDGFAGTMYYEGTTTYADFAAFLANANVQLSSVPEDQVVAGMVGSDMFVAFDVDGGDAADTVIKLTGIDYAHLDLASFNIV